MWCGMFVGVECDVDVCGQVYGLFVVYVGFVYCGLQLVCECVGGLVCLCVVWCVQYDCEFVVCDVCELFVWCDECFQLLCGFVQQCVVCVVVECVVDLLVVVEVEQQQCCVGVVFVGGLLCVYQCWYECGQVVEVCYWVMVYFVCEVCFECVL